MATTPLCLFWLRARPTPAGIWVYVRDDKPFGGPAPPGAVFYFSRDRAGKHPQGHLANYTGIFQADAYEGYGKLYQPRPILEARLLGPCPASVLRDGGFWPRTPVARRKARNRR